jgi:hypothetical protein
MSNSAPFNDDQQIMSRAASPAHITSAAPLTSVPQPQRVQPPLTQPGSAPTGDIEQIQTVFNSRRDLLAERLTVMMLDFGGLAYEMAIRNHFRLDILVNRAAEIQGVDAELGQLDRLLSLGQAGAAGDCPNCGALFARGAAFCAQCGFELVRASNAQSAPHVATPNEILPTPGLIKEDPPNGDFQHSPAHRHSPASLD